MEPTFPGLYFFHRAAVSMLPALSACGSLQVGANACGTPAQERCKRSRASAPCSLYMLHLVAFGEPHSRSFRCEGFIRSLAPATCLGKRLPRPWRGCRLLLGCTDSCVAKRACLGTLGACHILAARIAVPPRPGLRFGRLAHNSDRIDARMFRVFRLCFRASPSLGLRFSTCLQLLVGQTNRANLPRKHLLLMLTTLFGELLLAHETTSLT